MRGDLVIALHLPIVISLRYGECFFAAGDYGSDVLVSLVFLFYGRKVEWGQGGAIGLCNLHRHVLFAPWNQLFETSAVEYSGWSK